MYLFLIRAGSFIGNSNDWKKEIQNFLIQICVIRLFSCISLKPRKVLQRSCSRSLPEVSKKIQSILGRVFERDTIRNDRQIVNFGHQFHQPNEIFKLSQKRYGKIDFSSVRQMTLGMVVIEKSTYIQ